MTLPARNFMTERENNMGGMLTKEFLCIKKQVKLLLLGLGVAFIGMMPPLLAQGGKDRLTALSMVTALAVMLSVLLTINTMAYDETAKWDVFVKSLPLSSRTIVGAKYVLSLIFTAAGTIFTFAAALFAQVGPAKRAAVCIGAGTAPLVLCSIFLPLFYKFGLQKTRLAFILVFFGIPFLAGLLAKRLGVTMLKAQTLLLLKLSPLLALAVFAASFFIACRIYSRKEI